MVARGEPGSPAVRISSPLPSGFTSTISHCAPSPPLQFSKRTPANAIFAPSGDQAASSSSKSELVMLASPDPSTFATRMSNWSVMTCPGTIRVNAIWVPSADQLGPNW